MADEQEREDGPDTADVPVRPGRRGVLAAAGAAAAGVTGWAIGRATGGRAPARPFGSVVGLRGIPGITDPASPQRYAMTAVFAWDSAAPHQVLEAVAQVRGIEVDVTADAGAVTVTAGMAPAHASALWPGRAQPVQLPPFRTDTAEVITGGDLLVQVCAETEADVWAVTAAVTAAVPHGTVLWQQLGSRDAPTESGTARASMGFIDGIVNPRTAPELDLGVWSGGDHRDTYIVVRRTRIDGSFVTQPVAAQEQAIGRHRDTGAPLSGGRPEDDVDLFAKTPDGRLLTPPMSHARRAHPSNIGRPLMLRRSYSYHHGEGLGLVFTAFLSDPEVFVLTQHRLEEGDDLIAHTRVDASGCFFVPTELGTFRLTVS